LKNNLKYTLNSAICPFYKSSMSPALIRCEGINIEQQNTLHIAFASRSDYKEFVKKYCCSHNYKNCDLAKLHEAEKG